MAAAAIITLADEVASDLTDKSGGWELSFKAERKYQPITSLEDTDHLRVQVVPVTWRTSPDNRDDWSNEYQVDVGLHYRPSATAQSQAYAMYDRLVRLVEQISDYYHDTRPTLADCVLTGIDLGAGTGTPYYHESIETKNLFLSVIRLTFRKWR